MKNKPIYDLKSTQSPLLSKNTQQQFGKTQDITRERANWHYVEFSVEKLKAGMTFDFLKEDDESCIVIISGFCGISCADIVYDKIGKRMSPFEKQKPYAFYIPPKHKTMITALSDLEIAICSAPAKGYFAPRLITPDDIDSQARGIGNNQRFVHNILPEDKEAESLLVVEVFTDEGATSSYPSHKHDVNDPPNETYLEETYYHRINPAQGFCLQRVYTDDRTLDESMAVYDGDVVMVPKGYHPVATIAGYDSYYLNVMAGPVRKWCFTWEEDHAWINTEQYAKKVDAKA